MSLQLWPNLKWPNKLVVDCGRHLHPCAVKRDSIKYYFTLPRTHVLSRLSRVSNNHPWDHLRLAFLLCVVVVVVFWGSKNELMKFHPIIRGKRGRLVANRTNCLHLSAPPTCQRFFHFPKIIPPQLCITFYPPTRGLHARSAAFGV